MIKINEYFQFFNEINLQKYLHSLNEYENSADLNYCLHSVIVHKGSANSGHYYAYIKPTIENNWILFDDEIVRPADFYEVFDNNFGGAHKYFKLKPKGEISETSYSFESNAYILVYVKKSKRENLINKINIESVRKK
jgi:ubiquitin carboxyl-terminal hydrolase 7